MAERKRYLATLQAMDPHTPFQESFRTLLPNALAVFATTTCAGDEPSLAATQRGAVHLAHLLAPFKPLPLGPSPEAASEYCSTLAENVVHLRRFRHNCVLPDEATTPEDELLFGEAPFVGSSELYLVYVCMIHMLDLYEGFDAFLAVHVPRVLRDIPTGRTEDLELRGDTVKGIAMGWLLSKLSPRMVPIVGTLDGYVLTMANEATDGEHLPRLVTAYACGMMSVDRPSIATQRLALRCIASLLTAWESTRGGILEIYDTSFEFTVSLCEMVSNLAQWVSLHEDHQQELTRLRLLDRIVDLCAASPVHTFTDHVVEMMGTWPASITNLTLAMTLLPRMSQNVTGMYGFGLEGPPHAGGLMERVRRALQEEEVQRERWSRIREGWVGMVATATQLRAARSAHVNDDDLHRTKPKVV